MKLRQMDGEASAGSNATTSITHGGACYGRVRDARAAHHFGHCAAIFGGKKLPEIASGMGKAVREFKRATVEPEMPEKHAPQLTEPSESDGVNPYVAPK
jgi:TatA/E family protein of Tat protein translocase